MLDARGVAETGARAALERLAVGAAEAFMEMSADERSLLTRLRAHGRQLGDVHDAKISTQTIDKLTAELAYEYWHRMLFARFLAENNLLMHPDGVAVTLDECEELAAEEVWVWTGAQLHIYELDRGRYAERLTSIALPFLSAETLTRFVEQRTIEGHKRTVIAFQEWLRTHKSLLLN